MSWFDGTYYTQAYLDEYRGYQLVGCCIFLITLESIFVILRFYARYLHGTPWGWDDVPIPLAWLTNVGLNIVCINAVYNAGVGRHFAAVEMEGAHVVASWAKSLFAVDVLYLASTALPKISVISLYLRVFTYRWARTTCYILLVFIGAVWVSYLIAVSCQCMPFRYQWNKSIKGHCFKVQAFYQATSPPNLFSDVIIAILPIPTVFKLKISPIRKVGLMFVFALGSVGIVGSCIRMATFFREDAFQDNTWVSVELMAWSCVEPGMYLIAACGLSFRPLLNKVPISMPAWAVSSHRLSREKSKRLTLTYDDPEFRLNRCSIYRNSMQRDSPSTVTPQRNSLG